MDLKAEWLWRGYFDFGAHDTRRTVTDEIRTGLCKRLGLKKKDLRRKGFPVGPRHRHIVWWREGTHDYSEAQFVMQIAKSYPVLTLGIHVEKGFEIEEAKDSQRMDRTTWDWQRLVDNLESAANGVKQAYEELEKRPVFWRIHAWRKGDDGRQSNAFCYCGEWHHRHHGRGTYKDIGRIIRELDGMKDWLVDVYIGCDFSPADVESMTAGHAAEVLAAFAPLRGELRSE